MSKLKTLFAATSALLMLAACQSSPMLLAPSGMQSFNARNAAQAMRQPTRAEALVGVEGFVTGDNLNIKGPFFTSGKGKLHLLTPDAFKIEFQIAGHHLIVDTSRIDATKVRFVTTDVKANKTLEVVGTYRRNGNTTVFEMPPGAEVTKLTVRAVKAGNFETDVVQPGRLFPQDERGSNTLKFSKG